jgi:hypothetical protein
MEHDTAQSVKPLPSEGRLTRQFLVANALYLAVVHVWALGLPALGRDFAAFAGDLPMDAASAWFFRVEMAVFGGFASGYLLVNALLLYGCMVCTFFITRFAVGGPVWLGSLAMALLMAHPLKSEAVLNLSGAADLLPAFTALLALALYARAVHVNSLFAYALAFVAFAAGAFLFRGNAGLFLAVLLYEVIVAKPAQRRIWRMGPIVVVGIAAVLVQMQTIDDHEFRVTGIFGPLHFLFYPLGVLPETSVDFMATPWKLWLASMSVVAFFLGLAHVTAHRVVVYGLVGLVGLRLFNAAELVYPYHLIGGGKLIACIALFCVMFAAVCQRVMTHPKWGRPVVVMTTLLCVVFFAMQVSTIFAWRDAARLVQAFQGAALKEAQDGQGILVAPDYRFFNGAPLTLSESISHDTPFSVFIPHRAALRLNYTDDAEVSVARHSAHRLEVHVSGIHPARVLPWSYTPDRAAGTDQIIEAHMEKDEMRLTLAPATGSYPPRIVSLAPRRPAADAP